VRIASPTFYALGRSRIPVIVSAGAIVFNIVACVALARGLGFRGLALGTSLAALANGATLLWLLHRALNGIDGRRLIVTLTKTVIAATAMALMAAGVLAGMRAALPGGHFGAQAAGLASAIGAGLLALGMSAKLLRIREFDDVVAVLRRRSGTEPR